MLFSTGFHAKHIAQVSHLKQLVTFKTRDSGILDWFFTNRPKLITLSQLPKVGSSDHYTILAKPVAALASRPVVNKVKIRDMRDSAWRALGSWITQKDWTPNLNAPSCEDKFSLIMTELNQAIDTFRPEKVVKKTSIRPPLDHKQDQNIDP